MSNGLTKLLTIKYFMINIHADNKYTRFLVVSRVYNFNFFNCDKQQI